MTVITVDAEDKLLDKVTAIKNDSEGYFAVQYHLSGLLNHHKSDYQIKIGVNILKDLFRGFEYYIFLCLNGDMFLIFRGGERSLLEKSIFQIRYLFMDDPLAYNADGFENEDFCSVFDLEFQWKNFFTVCKRAQEGKITEPSKAVIRQSADEIKQRKTQQLFSAEHLMLILRDLKSLDISSAIRSQSICAAIRGKPVKPLFEETYVNISHLKKMMGLNVDLFSSKPLFKSLTEVLDKRVLFLMRGQTSNFLTLPLSININVKTLLSEDFVAFDTMLNTRMKKSVVVEISIADIFEDLHTFQIAKDALHRLGYRICIDGLDSMSFPEVSRSSLGCDLVKLQWHPDMVRDIGSEGNKRLIDSIKQASPNRVILTRCDDQKAVDYGYSLGISLFQGRHFDKILDPNSTVIN